MFLVSSGVDWARRGATKVAQMNPLDPTIGEMLQTVMDNGGRIMVCPPCAEVRGYEPDCFIDGTELAGSVAMLAVVADGASTLSF